MSTVITLEDIAFVHELGARIHWAELPADAPAPMTIGEFQNFARIVATQIREGLQSQEEFLSFVAALGIRL